MTGCRRSTRRLAVLVLLSAGREVVGSFDHYGSLNNYVVSVTGGDTEG